MTQLLIEPISQASADQRKGRCGRTESGICFRLYEEQDYATRPAHTDPEIKRVGLAGVILRMKALGLGDIESFPFLDPPQKRAIDEGYRVLEELGALDDERRLTAIGEQLGRLPLDPRLGRMILGGRDEGALREVLVIAAALGLQDPRERPQAAQQRADEAHRKFRDEGSDFASYLKLWAFWQEARARSSQGAAAQAVPRQLPVVQPDARVGGHPRAARPRDAASSTSRRTSSRPPASRSTARSCPGCSARSACGTPRRASTSARARRAS